MGREMNIYDQVFRSVEYRWIAQHYGDQTSYRADIPLIDHIDDGIMILSNTTLDTLKAFCLHPLFQTDSDLQKNYHQIRPGTSATAVLFAIEYRRVANAYLSYREISHISEIEVSPIAEVNWMLRADKIQNRASYEEHLRGKLIVGSDADRLDRYFQNWFDRLGIMDSEYRHFRQMLGYL